MGEKLQLNREKLVKETVTLLDLIQKQMFERAKDKMYAKVKKANDWASFMTLLNAGNTVLTPW